MPEQAIVAIHSRFGVVWPGALRVCGAGHDEFVERFQSPAVLDELSRQPVKQFRVKGAFPAHTIVARRGDDAAAHVMLPKAVDDYAGQQLAGALLRVRDPFGEGAAAIRGPPALGWRGLP